MAFPSISEISGLQTVVLFVTQEKRSDLQCRPLQKTDGDKSVTRNASVETYLLKHYTVQS
jgi:hypothetical protein